MKIDIDIISDVVCPWCLIGKRKLATALARRPELETVIRWRPYQLNPNIPPAGMDRKAAIAAKFGSLENAQRIYERVRVAGLEVGIAFNFDAIPRTPNTINAHRLIHWAGLQGEHCQDRVVESLFRRFFIDAQDIGADDVLAAAAEEAGMDTKAVAERLTSDEDSELIRSEETRARQLGVEGVPFFILGRRLAVSGAQPPEVFLQVFDELAETTVLT